MICILLLSVLSGDLFCDFFYYLLIINYSMYTFCIFLKVDYFALTLTLPEHQISSLVFIEVHVVLSFVSSYFM